MDFIAVTGVNLLLRRQRSHIRLFAVSFVASFLCIVLLFTVKHAVLYRLIVHFVLNTLMILFGFGKTDYREFLENWFVTYLAVIVLGGIVQWAWESSSFLQNFSVQVLLSVLIGYGVLLYFIRHRNFGCRLYRVILKKGTRSLEVTAYWDSGNLLKDPYTGKEICILSYTKAKCFLDAGEDRIRYVPYHSLGESDGMIRVTDVDELVLFRGNNAKHIEKTAIGIADDGLLEGKEYDLILHASLL